MVYHNKSSCSQKQRRDSEILKTSISLKYMYEVEKCRLRKMIKKIFEKELKKYSSSHFFDQFQVLFTEKSIFEGLFKTMSLFISIVFINHSFRRLLEQFLYLININSIKKAFR